jgi:hypothetical protein
MYPLPSLVFFLFFPTLAHKKWFRTCRKLVSSVLSSFYSQLCILLLPFLILPR